MNNFSKYKKGDYIRYIAGVPLKNEYIALVTGVEDDGNKLLCDDICSISPDGIIAKYLRFYSKFIDEGRLKILESSDSLDYYKEKYPEYFI